MMCEVHGAMSAARSYAPHLNLSPTTDRARASGPLPTCGGGIGWGVVETSTFAEPIAAPHPDPPPQRGEGVKRRFVGHFVGRTEYADPLQGPTHGFQFGSPLEMAQHQK